jgi:hypothetical protein
MAPKKRKKFKNLMTLVLSCITRQAVAETVENFRNSPRFHGGAKRLGTNTSEPRLLHPTSSRSQVRHGPRAEADNPIVLGIRDRDIVVQIRIRIRNTGTFTSFFKDLYQIRRPLGLVFVIYFWWLGELLLLYI